MRLTYTSKLKRDLERWKSNGLIDAQQYDAVISDVEARSWGLSFANIVSLLGIICLCFAAMTFVAANWEDMSRIVRAAILIAAMWISYGLAYLLRAKASGWATQILTLLGCAIFGASIMLISQMYHMQGEQRDAILLWMVGTLVAAALLRSSPALILGIGLLGIWHFYCLDIRIFSNSNWNEINWLFVPIWVFTVFIAWMLKSRWALHALLLAALFWIFSTFMVFDNRYKTNLAFLLFFLAMYLCMGIIFYRRDALSNKLTGFLDGFDDVLLIYMTVIIGMFIWIWQVTYVQSFRFLTTFGFGLNKFWYFYCIISVAAIGLALLAYRQNAKHFYDIFFTTLWLVIAAILLSLGVRFPFIHEAYALAVSIWFIRMGGRQHVWQITRFGYLGFAVIMLTIYFKTAGSLLGTAGFYLIAGVIMIFSAVLLPKIVYRFSARKGKQ